MDSTNPPKAKKHKTSVSEHNEFGRQKHAKRKISKSKDKHEKEVDEVGEICGTCGVKIEPDPSDPNELDGFLCEGKFCSGYHCNSHKSPTSTCSECGCNYCDSCVDAIDKCAMCWSADLLSCCDLDTMPCGELACSENNCNYYHHKRCNCEEEARDAAFERYKREHSDSEES